ncbi:MAG: S9 family peptidase [Gemmatimonadetes bacterium]|nr:S9 family peptidase [Gemmatimonadota bacterium]
MRRVLIPLLFVLIVAAPASAQKRGMLPHDYYRFVMPGEVEVSPNGDLVAFTVTTVVEKENKRHREIWMQRLANGAPVGAPFRFTDPTEESSAPSWSPDGQVLSFQSRRGKDRNATWFARVAAPGGEAYHVEGVEARPVWSVDGRWVVYAKAPGGDEDEEEGEGEGEGAKKRKGWIAPDAISRTRDAERFDGRVITSMRYKRDGVLTLRPHYSAREKSQLFIVTAAGGQPRQLTRVPFDVGGAVWSKDGRTLLFTGDELEDDEYNADLTADIYAVPVDGGEPRRLTANPGSERAPVFSADGAKLAFLSTPKRGAETEILVVDVAADGAFRGAPRNLTADWDLEPDAPSWTPDGRAIRFEAQIRGDYHLFEVPAAGGPVRQVTQGARQLGSFSSSRDEKVLAYTGNDPVAPPEVFVARGDASGERRITSFNDSWLAEVALRPAQRLTWTVADGTEVEGWVIEPVDYQPGRKYPMILKIHGGPHSAYGNTFFQAFHVLSAAGFFVLYTNPRGSSGYGHRFQYATRGQWGIVDREDYLRGVDAALARYPDMDPQRVGVSGGSYGGFMTNWLSATTDRFAAAVTSRSIVNWESWYGSSDAQRLTEYEFFGPPWEQRELYRKLSPITFVENVKIPVLIIHSENDYRTPIGDGEQWFMALRRRKVPVELVRYPRSSHGLSRTGEPWLLVDRLERIRTWFVHWLIEEPERAAARD